jgi:hypothetical protein
MKKIIYPKADGGVALITPMKDCGISLEEIAKKDVPAGTPYLFVEDSDLPDQVFFDAWEADFTTNDGQAIGPHAWFIQQYNAEVNALNADSGPSALVPVAFDQAVFPEEFTEEQKQEAYAQLVAYVVEKNKADLAQSEQSKAARIEQLNKMIAVQEAEMAA